MKGILEKLDSGLVFWTGLDLSALSQHKKGAFFMTDCMNLGPHDVTPSFKPAHLKAKAHLNSVSVIRLGAINFVQDCRGMFLSLDKQLILAKINNSVNVNTDNDAISLCVLDCKCKSSPTLTTLIKKS